MSRLKTIGWMLLVIIVIGIVAILTRTPVRTDAGSAEQPVPAAADTAADDTAPDDTAPDDEVDDGAGAQNSSQ